MTGDVQEVVVSADDGIRADTTAEGLAKLRPAFKKTGTTTAGNSSQVSDGAAAVMLMKRSLADKLGLKPLAVVRAYAVVGVAPDEMGTSFSTEACLVLDPMLISCHGWLFTCRYWSCCRNPESSGAGRTQARRH